MLSEMRAKAAAREIFLGSIGMKLHAFRSPSIPPSPFLPSLTTSTITARPSNHQSPPTTETTRHQRRCQECASTRERGGKDAEAETEVGRGEGEVGECPDADAASGW